ncbi:MAG: ABC transporter ATP-binding protein [Deferribacteres bacterium]|nr:ABC transporter ATP-binding protein [Deferribacteres bacterium]
MPTLTLEHIRKTFDSFTAVENFSLQIRHGEFVSLLGPSGCGKTTTLRMVAGLERPTDGKIELGETTFADLANGVFMPPEKRNIGMVFQSYAIWPHKSVFDNIAYPLKIKKFAKNEIIERVHSALALVNLDGLADRMPNQLSGGQQQRVALARGLVMEPSILLLDEPLSNLDAKLRLKMRDEIKDLSKRIGVTMLYVTHDQSEAMALSDRIVVMNNGYILQVGTPAEVRQNPADAFVRDFIH